MSWEEWHDAARAMIDPRPDQSTLEAKKFLAADRGALLELIARFHDDEPCELDHSGNCQLHGHFDKGPCPHKIAQQLLADDSR
jgi:hypothetical protein